ncbi:putative membrane protein [Kitasatospora sp. MAP12-15]|uniref:hypothetical protein n=1 Tax=unclassified Kitasatospora TaxID=2633591 RepID=UPI002475CDD9|nr:hypothetical protein [Kitasatospora sp. MAP12-44]MDH6107926.1 putative membrane protein [Kitasatospora sp. MAP12-44]
MTLLQSLLQFLAEAGADPAGPQARQLAVAVGTVGGIAKGVANTVGAVRSLRHRKDEGALVCCGACLACSQARAE